MRLVIAEKPSVGRTIANAISTQPQKANGYIDCGNVNGETTYVSWAQGHLIDLADPKAYGDKWEKWDYSQLPVDPGDTWKWSVNQEKGAGARYRALLPLMRTANALVNACDPDREGEAIFTRIIQHARLTNKPAMRLWTNSMDADGIRKAWDGMKPESDYQHLAEAADARAKADWITGMTASRVYGLLYNFRHCSVGRVETPTLAMIVERDQAIEHHVSTPFWTLVADVGGWTLESERYTKQEDADRALQQAGNTARITRITRKTARQQPPTLYDLTSLQRDANREAGLTAGATLQALQNLYEAGLATYPRTDSKYITTDDISTVKALLNNQFIRNQEFSGQTDPSTANAQQLANNSKVEGHTALLPTLKLTQEAYEQLSADQKTVITLIVRRLWEASGTPRIHEQTSVEADAGEIKLTGSSDRTIDPGWTAVRPRKPETGIIPQAIHEGQELPINTKLNQGETKPPAPYTDASLLSAMEHASRKLDNRDLKAALDDDSVHSGGLGTPATRASTIDKIIRNGYAIRKGKTIRSTPAGQALIAVADSTLKDVASTARMEQGLTEVAEGKRSEKAWLTEYRMIPDDLPDTAKSNYRGSYKQDHVNHGNPVGECPICGSQVITTRNGYWKCEKNISRKQPDGSWKHTGCTYAILRKTIGNNGKRLTASLVSRALAGKKPLVKDCIKSPKTGRTYDAYLIPNKKWGLDTKFPERKHH